LTHATDTTTGVASRLHDVRRRIATAAARTGRSPASVILVAVSKLQPMAAVEAAWQAGQGDFAESRAGELAARASAFTQGAIRWHFVGRLQRNKVSDVVGLAALVHSVDRLALAETLAGQAHEAGRVQRVLVQVNAGEDPAKAGVSVDEAHELVRRVRDLDGLVCEGLMTIPPLDVDPRPTFARLRAVRDELREQFPEVRHLSMGMSRDYETAVEEGATIVRVGEAIFGPRPGHRPG